MRNGGTPASSRLLLAACNSSFSAAESSSEDDLVAEFEWGVGCSLRTSLRTSTAGGLVSAAQGPGFTANIANETNRIRSMVFGVVFRRGDRRRSSNESSAFHLSR